MKDDEDIRFCCRFQSLVHIFYRFFKYIMSEHGLSPMHHFVSKVNAFLRRRRRKRCAMYIGWFTTPTGTSATHLRWNLMPTIKMKTGYTAARARMATLYLQGTDQVASRKRPAFSLSYASQINYTSFRLWIFQTFSGWLFLYENVKALAFDK